jgi:hypothetical protein
MKAKEYAQNYIEQFTAIKAREDLTLDEKDQKVGYYLYQKIMLEMSMEVINLTKNRGGSNSALAGAFKEGVQKWRAFAAIVNKEFDAPLIIPEGFKAYWKQQMPREFAILERYGV